MQWGFSGGPMSNNANQMALEAGHNVRILFSHYRELVTEADAKLWFTITPPVDAESVVAITAK